MENAEINRLNVIADSAFAVGDIHGDYDALKSYVIKKEIRNSCVICCGDCSIGYTNPEDTRRQMRVLSKFFEKRNVMVIFLRGNHDEKKMYVDKCVKSKFVKAVPDYTLLEIHSDANAIVHNILCIGGAISVNRSYLKRRYKAKTKKIEEKSGWWSYANPYYWSDEAPVYDENALDQLKQTPIEYVCTHTAPHFCYPPMQTILGKWRALDSKLEEDVRNERQTLTKIYSRLVKDGHQLKAWYYGHFHDSCTEKIYGTTFYLMDMGRSDDILSDEYGPDLDVRKIF
jgi:predicted phosphodiesterase